MMKSLFKPFTIILMLLVTSAISAQENTADAPSERKPSMVGNVLKKAKTFLDNMAAKGIDTTYLAVPKHGWGASVTSNFAGIDARVKGEDVSIAGNVNINMRSNLNGQLSLALGYRSLALKYSFSLAKGFSRDFNVSLLDNPIGVEVRSHSTDQFHGDLRLSGIDKELNIKQGDTKLSATLINAYYVFNSKRYSLPAAMSQSFIQKHSAGSVTAYAVFLHAKMNANSNDLRNALDNLTKIDFYQAAVGIGYGYNYTPNRGRLLLHLSAAPLLVFFSKSFVYSELSLPISDTDVYTMELSKEINSKHSVFLTGVARASVWYNLSPHAYIGAAALVNDIRFDSDAGIKITMADWVANATVGFRF